MIMFNEDLVVNVGATLKWVFYVLDNDSTTIDITNYEFKLQLKSDLRSSAAPLLDCTPYLDYSTFSTLGIVVVSVPYLVTSRLAGSMSNAYYDLKVKTPDGEVFIVSKGKVAILNTVTDF